jgi:hypothetical protein
MIVWGTRNGSRPIAIETGWTVQYQSSSDYTATVQQACIQELIACMEVSLREHGLICRLIVIT